MTTFNITVVQVAPKSATSKAGKPYRLVEVAYKNNTFGKLEEVKINQYNALFQKAAELKVGTSYDVTKEKDASGYFQWTTIFETSPAIGSTVVSPALNVQVKHGAVASTPVRSTYETPEERAKKQVYIVKQSSISAAIALLTTGAKSPPSTELIISEAQKFVDFVFEEKPLSLGQMAEMPNDLDMQVE